MNAVADKTVSVLATEAQTAASTVRHLASAIDDALDGLTFPDEADREIADRIVLFLELIRSQSTKAGALCEQIEITETRRAREGR